MGGETGHGRFGLRFAWALIAAAATACLTVAVIDAVFVAVQPAPISALPLGRQIADRLSVGLFFLLFAVPMSLLGGGVGALLVLSPLFLVAWRVRPSPVLLAVVGAAAGLVHTLLCWALAAWVAQKPTERALGNLEILFGSAALTDPIMGGYKHQLPILLFAAPLGGVAAGLCAAAILLRPSPASRA